jgi:hypothetical protein
MSTHSSPKFETATCFFTNVKEKWAGLRVTDERKRETDEKCVREMGRGGGGASEVIDWQKTNRKSTH